MSKAFITAIKLYGDGPSRRIYCPNPALNARRVEAFFDLNNICHPGVDGRPHARLHLEMLRSKLSATGVQWTVAFSHLVSEPLRCALRKAGIQAVQTLENADDQLMEFARKRIAGGLDKVILGTGDHFACELVELAIAKGAKAEVWTRSGRTSRRLAAMATKVVLLDDYLITPAAASNAANDHEFRVAA